MDIKTTVIITRDMLENVFVTAIEGGSNYWYFISGEAHDIVRGAVPKATDPCLSTALFAAVFDHGVIVPINDVDEEGEEIGEFDKTKFAERLTALAEDNDYKSCLFDEINEQGDASTSDVVFQYLLFGEVVYG